ncbi:lanthionine synthetase C family protein [Prauserella halophila]|uniref:Lanthionine synthetase C family protein n=1 Tax=Prauserella halophila TaxID=185641 RepID=A0ABP4GPT6_9PSEU
MNAVANRLADPDRIAAIAGREDNRDPIYDTVMWAPATLSNGWPGVATFFAELAARDTETTSWWAAVAHEHLARAGSALDGVPHRGMYAGPAAVLSAAQTAAGAAGHYGGLRSKLAEWLADTVLTRLEHERQRADGDGVDWFSYDLINGLAGSGRLLLDAAQDSGETGPRVRRALDGTLRHLVRLARPITVHGHRVPGWWVPAASQPTERDRGDYPDGDFNLGLAHGVPGPLAVLAHAVRIGYEVDGQRDAIAEMVEWLRGWRLFDDAGPYWPCRVSFAEETADHRMTTSEFTRTAWCYGAPGVAVALHAAGTALGEPEWIDEAVSALRAALERDESSWAIDGPTICHGYGGLLAICTDIGRSTGDAALLRGTARLVRSVLDTADDARPFVFPHLMRYPRAQQSPGRVCRSVDVAGLLEGAAGVAAALVPFSGEAGRRKGGPLWHRCLGLS